MFQLQCYFKKMMIGINWEKFITTGLLMSKNHFIEVKINSITQKMLEVPYLSINDIEESILSIEDCEEKNPMIQMDIFDGNSIATEDSKFKILREYKKLFFKLDKEKLHTTVKISKHLLFFLNMDHKIIGMEFACLSEEEWSKINKSIVSLSVF
ncbi:hypothetical protein [Candidatus Enterococcus murrayae]|uniref:hypothetical protein n=1 Tax=Candidatus Enterococcus murrayae TaxID=2815321 RepID=UPI001F5D2BC9|nr:hypothetical protein [Enterococcus sp. MJM16]